MAHRSLAHASSVTFFCVCARLWAAEVQATESVIHLLEALRLQGSNVIYSSDLVKPEMVVPVPAQTRDPMTRTREALASYGLMLKPMGANLYVVTLAPRPLVADTPAAATELAAIEPATVSVYASRYEIARQASGEPRLIDGTDIDLVPGTRDDAMRVVRVIPGFASNASTRPYIRGSFLDDVLVQFDGVPLADPFHLKNFQSLISAFDPEAVQRIEVYSGGFPVRYGTRSGGVIDIAPRSLGSGYEHTVGASLLSIDGSSVGHAERWPVDWLVTVRDSVPDVVLKPVNANGGEVEFSDTLGRLRWKPNEHTALTLGWLLLDDRIDFVSGAEDETATARYRDEYTWLALDQAFGEQLQSRTVLAGTWAERSRSGTLNSPGIASEQLDDRIDLSTVELRSQWTYAVDATRSWHLGLEAARAQSELTYDRQGGFSDAVAATFKRSADNALSFAATPEVMTYALSAALRERWTSLEAEIGVRVDGQRYVGTAFRHQLSPRLNLRYDINSMWRVYGSWGRFTQAQRVDEWRSEESQSRPDPAALAVHTIVGLSYEAPGAWRATVELYRKRWIEVRPYFDNLLDTLSPLPDLEPDRVRLSPTVSEAAGIELTVRRTFSNSFETWFGYALSRVVDNIGTADDVPRSWDQPHAVSGGAAWMRGAWRASALLGWHQGWPRTPLSSQPAGAPSLFTLGVRNGSRWGDFYTLDLNASWTHDVWAGELTLWADLTNATDRRNACCAHLLASPDAGTSADLESKTWLPRVFNVGFTWRLRPRP